MAQHRMEIDLSGSLTAGCKDAAVLFGVCVCVIGSIECRANGKKGRPEVR